jgi:hypothetical protein
MNDTIPKLMALAEWSQSRFVGTPPAETTVKRWCRDGVIPAKRIGGKWFVMVAEELRTTGDNLVDSVLKSS